MLKSNPNPDSTHILKREMVVYGCILVISKAVLLFATPLLLQHLTSAEFGIYSLFLTLDGLLIPLVTLNLHTTIPAFFHDNTFPLKEMVSTVSLSMIVLCGVFIVLVEIVPTSFLKLIGWDYRTLLSITIATVTTNSITALASQLLRLRQSTRWYSILAICQGLVSPILCVCAARVQPEAIGVMLARCLAATLVFLCAIKILATEGFFIKSLNPRLLKYALTISGPTIIYSLCTFGFLAADKIIINKILGPEILGRYAAIYQIVGIMSAAGGVVNVVWLPWFLNQLNRNTSASKAAVVKATYAVGFLALIAAVLYAAILSIVLPLLLPETVLTFSSVRWPLAVGFAFEIIYLLVNPYLLYAKRTDYSAYIGLFMVFFSVTLSWITVRHFGPNGAAVTHMLVWIALATLFYLAGRRVTIMPWIEVLKNMVRMESSKSLHKT